ncbi:hypothetical protein AVEN_155700-1 [Araneus ventricosus]|uniref:Uncharacterized protein n=1 Tax=Araneus ventricosus TaxID=182803 RepID=A0A4Y2TZF5_ARAVE|nr:hypothetical protein AVEN_155700-1 [Araneus ventricosus]
MALAPPVAAVTCPIYTGSWGIEYGLRFQSQRVPGTKPDSTQDPPCMWAVCIFNDEYWVERPPAGVMRKLG